MEGPAYVWRSLLHKAYGVMCRIIVLIKILKSNIVCMGQLTANEELERLLILKGADNVLVVYIFHYFM